MPAFPKIELDESTHTYRVAGIVRPSVTQVLGVLGEFAGVDRDLLERAARFGRHVHAAVDLFNRRELDEADLDPALVPYLNGWRKFLADTGAKVIHSEFRVWHPLLHYCGTADSAIEFEGPTLCDVKSGVVPGSVGAQTSAYAKADNEHGFRARARICVQLKPDGYKLRRLRQPGDFERFVSCLNVFRSQRRSSTDARAIAQGI